MHATVMFKKHTGLLYKSAPAFNIYFNEWSIVYLLGDSWHLLEICL